MLSLGVDRFAVFNYAHVPWLMRTMRKFDETTLPSAKEKLEIFSYTIDFFTKNGYKMIGMDHFAKPTDELFGAIKKGELHRNFQGYTTKGGADLVGVGLTSIGESQRYYAQNSKDMGSYESAIDSGKLPLERGVELSDDDYLRKRVIMQIMANFSINIKSFEDEFEIDFFDYFKESIESLEQMQKEGLLRIQRDSMQILATGMLLVRNVAMAFDAYMGKYAQNKKSFSKTV